MKRLLVVSVSALLLSACVTETTGVNRPEPKSASQRADIHTQLAANYLQRNQLEIALEEVEKALDADPRNQKANYIMALLQQRLRKPDQADSYFRKAIAGANPFPRRCKVVLQHVVTDRRRQRSRERQNERYDQQRHSEGDIEVLAAFG